MSKLVEAIRDHEQRLGMVDLQVRESVGGWQAIAKYHHAIAGPWGVGCDVDMVVALEKALIAGEHEMSLGRSQGQTKWTPELTETLALPIIAEDYEELI